MAIIYNDDEGVKMIPMADGDGLKVMLLPGFNNIPDDDWNKCTQHVSGVHKPKWLRIEGEVKRTTKMVDVPIIDEKTQQPTGKTEKKQKTVNKYQDIGTFSVNEQIRIIKDTVNPDTLKEWANALTNERALKTIREQEAKIEEAATGIKKK